MIIRSEFILNIISFFYCMEIAGFCFWPFIILRKSTYPYIINHEKIHFQQFKELYIFGMYFIVVYDFLHGLMLYRNFNKAYRQIRCEQEAYDNMRDPHYLNNRKKYSWLNYRVRSLALK